MMDPPDDDSAKSNVPPIPAVRRTKTTKTTITRSSYSATTPTQTTSSEGLREKVARYEKVWSSGVVHGGEDNVIHVDVKDIEKRLQEERERRQAESPLQLEFVKLRSTPQNTPGRETVSPDSPFNVTLRHIERPMVEEEQQQRPESPFNVSLRHVEKEDEGRVVVLRRTPPRSIDLTAGGSKISIKFDPSDEVDFTIEPSADIRVGSSGFRNQATESVITDGNRQTPQRISKTFIKSPVDGRSLTTIGSPFVHQQTTKKVSSVYVKNLQKSYLEGTSGSSGSGVASGSVSESDDLSEEASEWYNEYRNQSFNSTMTARQFTRTNSQYDNHIKEIRGRCSSKGDPFHIKLSVSHCLV